MTRLLNQTFAAAFAAILAAASIGSIVDVPTDTAGSPATTILIAEIA